MHPLLKTTDSFQIKNTQGLEYLSPTVAILLRVEMASVRCWLHVVIWPHGPALLSNAQSVPQLTSASLKIYSCNFTANVLVKTQSFRGEDKTACRNICPSTGTLYSPSSRYVSAVGQHLKDRCSRAHPGCITNQASHEQKPSIGSLSGENNNSRTLGSFPSKAERVARGKATRGKLQRPQSLISMFGQSWGCLKELRVNREAHGHPSCSKYRLGASKCQSGQVLTLMW